MEQKKQYVNRNLKRISEYTGYSIQDIRHIAADLNLTVEYDHSRKAWILKEEIYTLHTLIDHLEEMKTLQD